MRVLTETTVTADPAIPTLQEHLPASSSNLISQDQSDRPPSPTPAEQIRTPRSAKSKASPFFGQYSRYRTSNPSHVTSYQPPRKSFPLFSHLPFELRLKVWMFALTTPRILLLTYFESRTTAYLPLDETMLTSQAATKSFQIKSEPQLGALLSCCRESRYEAKKLYEPAFGYQLGKPIWFARKTDVLMFVNGLDLERFFERDWGKGGEDESGREKVVNVARVMEENKILAGWAKERQAARARELFPVLDLLTLVTVNGTKITWDGVDRLVGQDGELVRFLEGVKERKMERGWDEMDVVDFEFKDEGVLKGRTPGPIHAWMS